MANFIKTLLETQKEDVTESTEMLKQMSPEENESIVGNLTNTLRSRFRYQEQQGVDAGQSKKLDKVLNDYVKPETKAKHLMQMVNDPAYKMGGLRKKQERQQNTLYNKKLRDSYKDIAGANNLNSEQMLDAVKLARSDTRRKVNKLLKEIPEGTFATSKFQQYTKDDMKGLSKMSRNQLYVRLAKIQKMNAYEGMTIEGARRQASFSNKVFGSAGKSFDRNEKSAVWDYVNRQQTLHSLSSPEVIAQVNAILNDDKADYVFTEVDPGSSDGRLELNIINMGNDVNDRQKKAEITDMLLAGEDEDEEDLIF